MASDSPTKTFKLWLIIINVLFIFVGLATIGIGIYFYVYKGDLLAIVFEMRHIAASVILIIVCGGVILAFSLVGLCAGVFGNRCLLIMYATVLFLVTLMAIAAAVMALVYTNTWYIDEVRQRMRDRLQKQYGVNVNGSKENAFITNTWDTVQQMWYCCGVEDESWSIYRQSQWYNNQPGDPGAKEFMSKMVPPSCCLKSQYGLYINLQKCQNWQIGPPNMSGGGVNYNEALLYKGCFMEGRKILTMVGRGVTGLGICLAIFMALAIAPAVLMLRRQDGSERITKKSQYAGNYMYEKASTVPMNNPQAAGSFEMK